MEDSNQWLVITYKCPVCANTFEYKPKRIEAYNLLCPKCFASANKVGPTNPFDLNTFQRDCAELLILGGDIDNICKTIQEKYPNKNQTHVIEISRLMKERGFFREYNRETGWIKMTKILQLNNVDFNDTVTCTVCGDKNKVRVRVDVLNEKVN